MFVIIVLNDFTALLLLLPLFLLLLFLLLLLPFSYLLPKLFGKSVGGSCLTEHSRKLCHRINDIVNQSGKGQHGSHGNAFASIGHNRAQEQNGKLGDIAGNSGKVIDFLHAFFPLFHALFHLFADFIVKGRKDSFHLIGLNDGKANSKILQKSQIFRIFLGQVLLNLLHISSGKEGGKKGNQGNETGHDS